MKILTERARKSVIKIIMVFLFILLFPIHSFAANWDYDLKDAMIEKTDGNGKKSYTVDMGMIDYYIKRISVHARSYPPRFASKEEQKDVVSKLTQLLALLEIIGENQQNNPDFLHVLLRA